MNLMYEMKKSDKYFVNVSYLDIVYKVIYFIF